MKGLIYITLLSSMALQTLAQNATCPTTFNPSCSFLCDEGAAGTHCRSVFAIDQCSTCPGIPAVCPATPAASCAFLCNHDGVDFCSSAEFNVLNRVTCKACGSTTASVTTAATIATTAAASAPAYSSGGISCPAVFDPSCSFICDEGAAGTHCRSTFTIDQCSTCPGIPAVCPATPAASCAFLCVHDGVNFCSSTEFNVLNRVTCTSCTSNSTSSGGGTNPTTSASTLPAPTYTSGATIVKAMGVLIFGIGGVAFLL
ncbi:hypothetical protein TWF694_000224 [Orbilia ellipsospora]|uniref:Uncharacterized protein n=1 Tax=Orbilia ellipsospora TaxID=2528407 RepID=A0AAV9XNC4_9PEZI